MKTKESTVRFVFLIKKKNTALLLLKYSEYMYECNLERKKGEKIQFEKPTKLSNLSHRETTEKSPRYNFHPTEFHVFNQADQRRNATRREENPLDKQKEFRIFSKLVTAPFNRHFPLFLVNDAPPIFTLLFFFSFHRSLLFSILALSSLEIVIATNRRETPLSPTFSPFLSQ